MATFPDRAELYERRVEALSPSDLERLEIAEQDILVGTEDHRAADIGDVRIAYFDFGFIAFQPMDNNRKRFIAFRFFDRL